MNKKVLFFGMLLIGLFLQSCDQAASSNTLGTNDKKEEVVSSTLSKDLQTSLTPAQVITRLKAGNKNFVNGNLTPRDFSKQLNEAVSGQYPEGIILSCVDSRVPVEHVFDKGVGDLFVARVAGNFVNEDILGSMEYACKVAGSKLVVVLGHEHCGAVKATIDDVKLGNITPLLAKIKPALEKVEYDGERKSKNPEFVHKVTESNVQNTINEIRIQSPILKEMEDNGEIKIVGALYDMDNGSVNWLD